MDVKTTFLHGFLDSEIFMDPLEGFFFFNLMTNFICLKDLYMAFNSFHGSGMNDFTIMLSNLTLKEACSIPTGISSLLSIIYSCYYM